MKFLQLTIWLLLIGYNLSAAPEQTLVILQTTDIHCHLTGEEDNWLKLATIIRHERLSAGRDNVLLIDCGDTVAGTFTATRTRGGIAVKILNALQYDVWIPGNHDYDFGIAALLKYHRDFSGRMLAANLQITGHDRKPLAGWKIFNRNGIKIAVIGLSLPDSEKNYWRDDTFTVISGLNVMPQVMDKINRHQPDVIILAAHCGLYSANKMMLKLARRYPEIKLFLGGHTHRNVPGEKIGSNGWYVQAGKHAGGVAKISIKFSAQSRRVKKIESYIIPVTKTTPVDQQCLAVVRDELNEIRQLGQQELGSTKTLISALAKFGTLSTAATLNGQAIAVATKTQIAFISAKYDVSIPAGKITRKQAFALYPYQDTVSTLMLTANETKAVIEEQAKRGTRYHWLTPVGLHFAINRQGKVVGKLRFTDGTSWEADAPRIKITFSSYDLAGIYGRKFPLLHKLSLTPECRGVNTKIKIYQAVADYIQQHSPLKARDKN
ncbi:MAG: metallophosphoesterase [Victivallaceae bacterium]|nr:metallophosphoesterase [Victivallaceae bacterium]